MRELKITQSITNREVRSLEAYLDELGKIRLISADEEAALACKIRQGDKEALERLVRANLRFVVSVAKKYQHLGMPLSDLINEGNLGLIKAAQRFDESRGFKFISFAVWWIRQSILFALAEHRRMVRLPMNQINLLTKIGHRLGELENQLERQPTTQELAEFLELESQKVADACFYSGQTISYDRPLTTQDEFVLIDLLQSQESPTDHLVTGLPAHQQTEALLSGLTAAEREVIEYRFGFKDGRELSNRAIAEILGCYPEKVRLLVKTALGKLKGFTHVVR